MYLILIPFYLLNLIFFLSIVLLSPQINPFFFTGHETKAMLNNRGPRYKRSKLERKINHDIIWCVFLLIFLCIFCASGKNPNLLTIKFLIKIIRL